MDGFSDSSENASARGYILRSLVRGSHFTCLAKTLSNKMLACGLITDPDISKQLYYLQQLKLIEFTDSQANAFNAIERDALIRLTVVGIRFIEDGGKPEMGIDL